MGTDRRALTPEERAWCALVPVATVTVLAILLAGQPLGALLSGGSDVFWRGIEVRPEPTEHARYVLAAIAPFALAAVVIAGGRVRLRPAVIDVLTRAAQVGVLAAVLVVALPPVNRSYLEVDPRPIFGWISVVAALGLAGLLAFALLRAHGTAWAAAIMRESRARRIGCWCVAVLATAAWMLTAVNSDLSAGSAFGTNLIPWNMSEAFAVLNGRTPLVDFHTQYAHLLPYVGAGAMALLGDNLQVWTVTMVCISGLALVSVHAVLARVVRSSTVALLLYLPFLATAMRIADGPVDNRFSPAAIFSLWPLRYAGPFLLAWLVARHVDGAAPRRAWLLMLAGGLVVFNNAEFGVGAFAATVVAVGLHRPPGSWKAVARLLAAVVAGLAGAAVAVAAATLARSGRLPDLTLVLEFPRIYGRGGWVLIPMPIGGLHLAVYATFAAAIVTAAVRAARRADDRLLTSMLAWSGVFGLVAGGYFAGRSDRLNLLVLLAPWGLALLLLLVAAVRAAGGRADRLLRPDALAVLLGVALMICSLVQLPLPWQQVERLGQASRPPEFVQDTTVDFVAANTEPGEKVLILIPLGHRIAHDAGVVNVSPYSSIESMPTVGQMDTALEAATAEGVTKAFILGDVTLGVQAQAVAAAGFRTTAGLANVALLERPP